MLKVTLPAQVYNSFHKESEKLSNLAEFFSLAIERESASSATCSQEIYEPIRVQTDMLTASLEELTHLAHAMPSSDCKTVALKKWEHRQTRINAKLARVNQLRAELQKLLERKAAKPVEA